ncbi:unnamed protein product [Medioppia subpectinata]|uniref:Cytochrome P450 n=1 Tax=Medioppia subpectinata TaxID=1979941 RepID=A0A7R9KH36_9ACAR|nr:unnamed protein product [Medioppia subpectinata]CAG2103266.1 unnamed protein product [Medioppia subpectinata]
MDETAINDESGTGSPKLAASTPAVPPKQMSDDEVRANTFVILMSAYETTATTLTIAMYELALQLRLQERLYAELKAAMNADGEIDYDKLQSLTYLDQVVSETLRLHPPGIRATRLATQDYKLGDTGITIRKGQQVDIPTYAIHHSPENYPDPYRYDPDRFSPANRGKIKPYTYAPFGSGPRHCIGMRFALLEIKLSLAHIITRYKLYRLPETDVPLQYRRKYRLTFPKRVIIGIEFREK